MNYDELTDREKEIWDMAYEQGHDAGWDEYAENFSSDDWDNAYEEGEHEGFNAGFEKGVLTERQRVQDVLNMMFEAALNMGQGNKAVQYRQMMDLLTPVQIQQTEDDF